jgi:hypothetical protein
MGDVKRAMYDGATLLSELFMHSDWVWEIGFGVAAFALHAMFAHGGDLGEAYDCDNRRRYYDAEWEFNLMPWLIFGGLLIFLLWSVNKGMSTPAPRESETTQPVAVAARAKQPAVSHTVHHAVHQTVKKHPKKVA